MEQVGTALIQITEQHAPTVVLVRDDGWIARERVGPGEPKSPDDANATLCFWDEAMALRYLDEMAFAAPEGWKVRRLGYAAWRFAVRRLPWIRIVLDMSKVAGITFGDVSITQLP